MFGGPILRPVPGQDPASRVARWIDSLGADSAYDYDPVWQRCVELGVAPTFHSAATGWGSRTSPSSYVFNHIGMFATAGEAMARSLFLGGVAHRFPQLHFAFLEGGVAWAASLYSDLIGHWEKRNREAVEHYNPAHLDRERLARAVRALRVRRLPRPARPARRRLDVPQPPRRGPGDARRVRRVRDRAPPRTSATSSPASSTSAARPTTRSPRSRSTPRRNPLAARFKVLFASDIGHWDVPDVARGASRGMGAGRARSCDRGRLPCADVREPGVAVGGGQSRVLRGDDRRGRGGARARQSLRSSASRTSSGVAGRRPIVRSWRTTSATTWALVGVPSSR